MLGSPGWRTRGSRYFVVGLIAGGLTSGALLMIVVWGVPKPPSVVSIVGILAVSAYALANVLGVRWANYLPQNPRQVPQDVRLRGGVVGGLQFGFEMGTGLRTFMTTALPHVCLVTVLLTVTHPRVALLVGGSFALGRAMVLSIRRYWLRWDDAIGAYKSTFTRGSVAAGTGVVLFTVIGSL